MVAQDFMRDYVLIDSADALESAVVRMRDEPVIGVDTESNSMHCYRERVCFVQLRAGATTYLVDTIRFRDLSALAPLFADPRVVKVLHGADYDVVCLRRDFDLTFVNLFDTMLAAQFLNYEGLGLAALCERHFGVKLDKSLTRHNWALRPVEDRHLRYLCGDVVHLAELRRILEGELHTIDLFPEVECEFERVSRLEWSNRAFDPEKYLKIKGALDLDPKARTVLREIFIARESVAEELDFPPFMVMNPDVMLALAHERPTSREDFGRRFRLPRRAHESHIRRFVDAIARVESGETPIIVPSRPPRTRKDPREIKCEDDLRKWRTRRAAAENRPPLAILPNHVMAEILSQRVTTADALARVPYFGDRRRERYGAEILEITRKNF